MYSMGNWTIFAFLLVAILMTMYVWYVFGSHSGYRGVNESEIHHFGVLDAMDMDGKLGEAPKVGQSKKLDVEAV